MITGAVDRLLARLVNDIAATAAWCAVVERDGSVRVLASAGLADGIDVSDAETSFESYLTHPVVDEDGLALGVVTAACDSERTWSDDENERLADVALVAAALISTQRDVKRERRWLDRERDARLVRRDMYELARNTSSTDSREQIAHALANGTGRVLDARLSVLALPVGDEVCFVHGEGVPDEVAARWGIVDRTVQVPLVQCMVTGEAIELPTREAIGDWPLLAPEADRSGISAFFSFPITDEDGEVIAALGIGLEDAATLTMTQRLVIQELLTDAGLALTRSSQAELVAAIAMDLQQSLLPPSLPDVQGIDVHALYESSANGTSIGGDWYDVVPITDTLTAFVVGDATGHDVRSAAMMGQVRHVVASQLRDHRSPALALSNTDGYFAGLHENVLATVIVIVVDTESNTATVASAGHPPPIMISDGATRLVDITPGAPIGSGFGSMTDTDIKLGRSCTMIAASDGVYERRGGDIDTQLADLVAEIDAVRDDTDALHQLLLRRVSADTIDDATALIISMQPTADVVDTAPSDT